MDNLDTPKQRNIDVSDRLYNAFKGEAARRGMYLKEAFIDALQTWIDGKQSGLPPLTVQCPSEAHRDVILDLLPMLNRPEAINFIAAFRALLDVERTKQRKEKGKF